MSNCLRGYFYMMIHDFGRRDRNAYITRASSKKLTWPIHNLAHSIYPFSPLLFFIFTILPCFSQSYATTDWLVLLNVLRESCDYFSFHCDFWILPFQKIHRNYYFPEKTKFSASLSRLSSSSDAQAKRSKAATQVV